MSRSHRAAAKLGMCARIGLRYVLTKLRGGAKTSENRTSCPVAWRWHDGIVRPATAPHRVVAKIGTPSRIGERYALTESQPDQRRYESTARLVESWHAGTQRELRSGATPHPLPSPAGTYHPVNVPSTFADVPRNPSRNCSCYCELSTLEHTATLKWPPRLDHASDRRDTPDARSHGCAALSLPRPTRTR